MNIFVGNFSVKKEVKLPNLDLDIIQVSPTVYFIMGADEAISTSKEIKEFLRKHFGEIETIDISIETEHKLEILTSEYEEGVYECVNFEGPEISFEDILERFADSGEVICVRETEESKKYENKIVKVDFIY